MGDNKVIRIETDPDNPSQCKVDISPSLNPLTAVRFLTQVASDILCKMEQHAQKMVVPVKPKLVVPRAN